jgi:UDP-N-acetyl-D-glucosamine dehydrogenase
MGSDVWELIEAAKIEPFGLQAFCPSTVLGGHRIPIDPYYLSWKAPAIDIDACFIELAGQIFTSMPRYVVSKLAGAPNTHKGKGLSTLKVLDLGLAYENNAPDIRDSLTLRQIELLENRRAICYYHGPHVLSIPPTHEHSEYVGCHSLFLCAALLKAYDAVAISIDQDMNYYRRVNALAELSGDTRNKMAEVPEAKAIIAKS